MTRDKTIVSLHQMLDHAVEAVAFLGGAGLRQFESDRLTNLAVAHLVEIIGEAANRISAESQIRYAEIPWRDIVNMRNVIAHGDDVVDLEAVWKVVVEDLPPLIIALEDILNEDSHEAPA